MAKLPADVKEFSEERREASPANFLIKFECFSLLSKYGIWKYKSRAFDAGGYKWKLKIFHDGLVRDENDHDVSVYFSVTETEALPQNWEVNAIFIFFLYNQILNNYHCFRGMTRRFNALTPQWGLSKLMSNKSLMDPSNGYVVNDCCVFGAEVFIITNERINECVRLLKDTVQSKREWKISDFSKLGDVWNSEEFFVGDHKWKVYLYLMGDERVEGRYISIYVECVDSDNFKVRAEVIMCIKSKLKNAHHHSKQIEGWYTSSSSSWGYEAFIPVADMSSRGFLVDDCCYLDIQITVLAHVLDASK